MTAALVGWCLVATVVLGFAAVLDQWTRRWSASRRHQIWIAATLVVLSWPAIVRIAPEWPAPNATAPLWPNAPGPRVGPPRPAAVSRAVVAVPEPVANATEPAPSRGWLPGLDLVFALWFLVAAGRLALVLRRYRQASRLVRTASDVTALDWLCDRDRIATAAGVARPPVLRCSSEVPSPVVWGFGRGVIVIPESMLDLDTALRSAVLRHEVAHVARRDHLGQLAGTLLTVFHWYHPFAWLGRLCLLRTAELACDDRVVNSGAKPSWYAEALLGLATRDSGTLGLPVTRFLGSGELELRIASLTDARVKRGLPHRWSGWCLGGTSLLVAALFAGLGPPVLPGALGEAVVTARALMATPGGPPRARPRAPVSPVAQRAAAEWQRSTGPCPRFTGRRDLARHCEHRVLRFSTAALVLDAGQNGSVRIVGTDGDQVVMHAVLDTQAADTNLAAALANRVRIETEHGIRPSVPPLGNAEWAGVSFWVEVPRHMPLTIMTANGAIDLRHLAGPIDITTVNGTVDLADIRGTVQAEGTNARYRVVLDTPSEAGRYDLHSINGTIEVALAGWWGGGLHLTTERGTLQLEGDVDAAARCLPGPQGCRGAEARLGDSNPVHLTGSTIHGHLILRAIQPGEITS